MSEHQVLLRCIRHVRPELHRIEQWMLLHDNVPACCAICVCLFLAQYGLHLLDHPLYSPDLVPTDFLLFSFLKSDMEGARFMVVVATQEYVAPILQYFRKEAFADIFQKLYERCQ
ncbi:hypothetical protein PR048_031428 [Dryococelus australis]|uniref:Uncharacterized protein n=1 Tax=Dryococelus australis TaxID=614101 RepID=A0ABQ9G585_9NEOP|nr:hypothetical protein PR048_031428 [Dryococelus australis]